MRRLLAGLILLLGLLPAMAQDLPQWQSTMVNDFAGLLTPEDAAGIDRMLADLRDQTGVEGTVVTLPDRARYGGKDGLEPFATRLFNHWGVGDAQRNNGFMLLVLTADREARIELGRGYQNDADIIAQDITRRTLLPAFRDGRMSQGIRDGTRIAGSDPALWRQILTSNAAAVRHELLEVAADLTHLIQVLDDPAALERFLAMGQTGALSLVGKHGAEPIDLVDVTVEIPDEPRALGRLFTDIGDAGLNVEDFELTHDPVRQVGYLSVQVAQAKREGLEDAMRASGWTLRAS